MQYELPEALVQVRDNLRRFVAEEIEPRAGVIEETNDIPDALLAKAAALGLFGLSIPEEYGGSGTSEVATCVALEALGHGPGGVTFYVAPSAPAAAIRFAGTEEQRRKYLPALARGDAIPAFCLTEAGAGSDAAGIRTRAVRQGDRWVINGSKLWISRARRAGVFLVSAVTDPEKRGKGGVTIFILDKRPGITVGKADRLLGVAGSGSAEVSFENCEATDADVLGTVGGGFDVLKYILGRARLWASARAVGMCSRALELSVAYADARVQFGKKIGEFQAIKLKLADMACDLYTSRLLLYRAAALFDQDLDPVQEVSMAKLFCTEAAGRAADMAVQIHGAMGLSREFQVERLYRDCRAFRIIDGTSDLQRMMIASNVQKRGIGEALAPGGLV
ncbi:MAG: acyl-CoA dehydrogenase family protein [Betaproteobacteria bacterium]|nr:acyl-CoA dehydrogenase family protein [Betaproteobacteria bacterium]